MGFISFTDPSQGSIFLGGLEGFISLLQPCEERAAWPFGVFHPKKGPSQGSQPAIAVQNVVLTCSRMILTTIFKRLGTEVLASMDHPKDFSQSCIPPPAVTIHPAAIPALSLMTTLRRSWKLKCKSNHCYGCPAKLNVVFINHAKTLVVEHAKGWLHKHGGESNAKQGLPQSAENPADVGSAARAAALSTLQQGGDPAAAVAAAAAAIPCYPLQPALP